MLIPHALSDAELDILAPGVFATHPHSSRSDRFRLTPTSTILNVLRAGGFEVVQAQQCKVYKDKTRADFAKHMLRFRHRDYLRETVAVVDEVYPEIVMLNAHDGTSRHNMIGGMWRTICANGMAISESMIAMVSIKHSGNAAEQVLMAATQIIEKSHMAIAVVDDWSRIRMSPKDMERFAEMARVIRYGDTAGLVTSPVTTAQLLAPRRPQDEGNSLWHVFNRVQENAIQGGLQVLRPMSDGRKLPTSTRPVKAIDANLEINRGLWELAHNTAKVLA